MEKIEILLASYNGQRYIAEMIESILAQDYQGWHLTVSDDQSSDGTAAILEFFSQRYPERITHYRSGKRFGNAQDHFMHLVSKFHDAPYIMFCDQDDVWHPDKIRKTLEKMKQTEKPGIPVLVHTDLRVVDGELHEIESSFFRSSGLTGSWATIKEIMVQNVVTGCTVMINHSLASLVINRLPEFGMIMHDHWLALVASAFGQIGYLEEATIDYRQHGNNSVGAKKIFSWKYISNLLKNDQIIKRMKSSFRQAGAFLSVYSSELPEDTRQMIQIYAGLEHCSKVKRRIAYIRYGFWKIGLSRRIGQIFWG